METGSAPSSAIANGEQLSTGRGKVDFIQAQLQSGFAKREYGSGIADTPTSCSSLLPT
jgi:hypothetical protein